MKYEFSAEYAIHEEGQKYYQVIMIREVGSSRGVVVTHWGKMHPGAPVEPKNHGQSKVEFKEAGIVSAKQQAVSNKTKRGYRNWQHKRQENGISDFEIWKIVNGWFKKDDVETILAFLKKNDSDDPFEEETYDDVEPSSPPTITENTKEDWGSW